MDRVNQNYFIYLIGGLIAVSHALSFLTFGATYWYDSISYFDMSYCIFSHEGLTGFYDGARQYLYQHVGAGTPLLWGVHQQIFGTKAWQAYALVQHAVAAAALLYFLMALRGRLSPYIIAGAAVIVPLHPFYEAFHNSVMTESVTGSMLLFLAGAAVLLAAEENIRRGPLAVFTTAGVVGAQFRPQLFLVAATLLLGIVLIRKLRAWRQLLFAGVVVLASLFLFPVVRWGVTGKFFLPNTDYLGVTLTLFSNVSQSREIEELLTAQDFPAGIDAKTVASKGLSYGDSMAWISHLKSKGKSDSEIKRTIQEVAWKIKFANWENVSSQIDAALAGVGLLGISFFHNNGDILSEGLTAEKLRAHERGHFIWLTWTLPSDYGSTLDDYLKMYRGSGFYHPEAIELMHDALRTNVSSPRQNRDPLNLAKLGTDIWVYGWMLGLGALFLMKKKELLLALGTPPLINYGVMVMMGFGNVRYSYILFPLYIVTSLVFVVCLVEYALNRFTVPVRTGG